MLIMLLVFIGYLLKKTRMSGKKYVEVLFFVLIVIGILSYESVFSLLSSISPYRRSKCFWFTILP